MNKYLIITCTLTCMLSCNSKPRPIIEGDDACVFCKMHIADKRFAWETISNTGKISVFDDVSCLQSQIAMHTEFKHNMEQVYVTDYANPEVLLPAEQAFFYVSPVLHSPMGGNVAAFSDNAQRNMLATEVPGQNISYQLLIQK